MQPASGCSEGHWLVINNRDRCAIHRAHVKIFGLKPLRCAATMQHCILKLRSLMLRFVETVPSNFCDMPHWQSQQQNQTKIQYCDWRGRQRTMFLMTSCLLTELIITGLKVKWYWAVWHTMHLVKVWAMPIPSIWRQYALKTYRFVSSLKFELNTKLLVPNSYNILVIENKNAQ